MTGKRTELPSYLKDPNDNEFLVSLLTDKCFAQDGGNDIYARRANIVVTSFIEQTKRFFPERYEGGGEGGNVTRMSGGETGGNFTEVAS